MHSSVIMIAMAGGATFGASAEHTSEARRKDMIPNPTGMPMDPVALTLADRSAALVQLGVVMRALGEASPWPGHSCGLNEAEYLDLEQVITQAQVHNGWSTVDNVRFAMRAWGTALNTADLATWLAAYPELAAPRSTIRTVGAVLAGNVPLVGLHDVICIWLSGHRARIKTSGQEPQLIPALLQVLERFAPGTAHQLQCTVEKLGPVEAVIATGSNNTARYFEHYFGHLPRIVRRNRVSVAVLDGTESVEQLPALGEDVFRYFGLGCRNVSKVYVPQDFQLDRLFEALYPWHDIVNHNKYGNNYDYTRALWLLDGVTFLENGFLLVKEDEQLPSPVATLFYERYADRQVLNGKLAELKEQVQCVVSLRDVPFGHAQHPGLGDYADGVDTLRFLLELP
jgi:hypothetical protein